MTANTLRARLKTASIHFTEETGFSGFTYTRFVFSDRRTAIKVEKLLNTNVNKHFKNYAITIY